MYEVYHVGLGGYNYNAAGRPATNVNCYWRKVITWYKIELGGRLLGNEASNILKCGAGSNNNNNNDNEECHRFFIIYNMFLCMLLYIIM